MTDLSGAGGDAGHDDAPDTGAASTPTLDDMRQAAEKEGAAPEDGEGDAGQEQPQAKAREPLPPEEVERRWRQTQGALREARASERQMRNEMAQLREQFAKGSPQGQDDDTPPDPIEDPLGALEWQQRQLVADREARAAERQTQAQAREQQQLVASLEEDEKSVLAANPDYHDAIAFLQKTRRDELLDLGAHEDDVDGIVAAEFREGILEARRNNLSPARVALKIARDRGFTKKDQLATIERGQAAARSIGAAGGARGSGDPGQGIESQLANLSGAALTAAWKKHKESRR